MERFLKLTLIIFIFSNSFLYAQTDNKVELNKNFTHVVYFWLENPDHPDDREDFENSLKKFLSKSEYAQTNFIGIPAKTPREVVDNSYTYSLILSFSSKEEQEKYQKEPAHLKFIEESEHLWKKVLVYDSIGIN